MKYVLHVLCEHDDPHTLAVPLSLDGGEPLPVAIEKFKDALIVAANAMMVHHGRSFMVHSRIDGVPSQEESERNEVAMESLGLRA